MRFSFVRGSVLFGVVLAIADACTPSSSAQCPLDHELYSEPGRAPLCSPVCLADSNCPSGVCRLTRGDNLGICVPLGFDGGASRADGGGGSATTPGGSNDNPRPGGDVAHAGSATSGRTTSGEGTTSGATTGGFSNGGTNGPPGPCTTNEDCATSQVCQAIQCDSPTGYCIDKSECDPAPSTVCGCDGKSYPSMCAAFASGVRVSGRGDCTNNNECPVPPPYNSSRACWNAGGRCASGTCCGKCDTAQAAPTCCAMPGQACGAAPAGCCRGFTCGSDCLCH